MKYLWVIMGKILCETHMVDEFWVVVYDSLCLNFWIWINHYHESKLEVELFLVVLRKLLIVNNCRACIDEYFVLLLWKPK